MSEKKHEILLIVAALFIASSALLYSVLDSPKYNKIEAVPITTKTTVSSTSVSSGKVNINTADIEDLTQLEFIGEMKAQAIIDYREENGSFRRIEEITNVDGIDTAILEKNYDRLTV